MSAYIKNPKDQGGSKFLSAQDQEDFEQEMHIKAWLEREGRAADFGYEHINRKGNARNTLVRAHVHLDAKVQEDGSGTFADLVAGSDGRDLECAGGDRPADELSDAPANLDELFCAYAAPIIKLVGNAQARVDIEDLYLEYLREQCELLAV